MQDFAYLKPKDIYMDTACQSLRPQPVIDALNDYYTEFNSCGERVKYQWGRTTDQKVSATRQKVLKYLKLSSREYFVSFTLNTTYGINLILQQLKSGAVKTVITSDIEHNSPFLATMSFAKKQQIPRQIISRDPDGSVDVSQIPERALVVLNCASNIDGRRLENIKEVIKATHKKGGLIIIDAAQAMAHQVEILQKTSPDAICFSAHKMYGPSLGVIVARKDFIKHLEPSFVGGGMVDDVEKDRYYLSADNQDHLFTIFEPGLQAWGEIIALGASIDWLNSLPKTVKKNLDIQTRHLYDFLADHPKIKLINQAPTPVLSFYVDGLDSHLLGQALADQGIMARTGYFCVHYYLDHIMHYPPLIRLSLGYHTRSEDIGQVIQALSKI